VFPRAWRPQLLTLRGDAGAAALLRATPVIGVEIGHAAADLDTRADLDRIASTRYQLRAQR
jgi:CTP:molybdopterin cytidylyltransferase MocA